MYWIGTKHYTQPTKIVFCEDEEQMKAHGNDYTWFSFSDREHAEAFYRHLRKNND